MLRIVTLGLADGLHGRTAARLRDEAMDSGHDVRIGVPGDEPVDATDLLAVIGLGLGYGDRAELTVTGADDDAIGARITAFLSNTLPQRS